MVQPKTISKHIILVLPRRADTAALGRKQMKSKYNQKKMAARVLPPNNIIRLIQLKPFSVGYVHIIGQLLTVVINFRQPEIACMHWLSLVSATNAVG